jgi:hypothetical protein
VCSILKPNAPPAKVAEDIQVWKLGKYLTKQHHIIIMGGPGSRLERNYHYSIENYLSFIAKRTSNTSVQIPVEA